jgi:hypothetical protein
MRRVLALIGVLTLLFFCGKSLAAEFVVGVSPPIVDLGEIGRGESKIVKFYIVTPSTEPLIVNLEREQGSLDFFSRDAYKPFLYNYSEEVLTSWAEFLVNPVELKPTNESLKTAAGEVRGWREVSFILNVPNNAEPGYHLLRIKPLPAVPSEVLGQAGARVVAVTGVNVLFKIPGDAKRDGIILDVVPGSYIGNRLEINTYFKNTGTVTVSARASHEIVANNTSIANITSSTELVKPGELKVLKAYLDVYKDMPQEIEARTTVSYTTGSDSKVFKLSLPPIAAPYVAVARPQVFPWWLIIALIVIVVGSILVYKWYK